MKYHPERDQDNRYITMEICGPNPFFNAHINLRFPSPAYKYELTDEELEKFANRLQRKWFEIFIKEVEELLK